MKEEITTDQITLSIKRWYSQRKINHPIIKEMGMNYKNFETYLFEMLEDYDAAGLRHLCRIAVKEETEAAYPRDWWQHFKERWFPQILLNRFPIQYTKIIAMHKFPHWEKELGKEHVEIRREEYEQTN